MRVLVLVLSLLAALPTAGAAQSLEALFAPSARLWPRWERHDATSTQAVDHGAWDEFLRRYVKPGNDGVARVAYGAVDDEIRRSLAEYIDRLQAVPVDGLARGEQLAFWLNLYNALTVKVVLDHYPVRSIRDIDISPGLFADGPWDRKLVTIAGEALTLNDIEHRILRPIWRDPRLHYAVNCASLGCPNLPPVAFTAANVDAMLEAAARAYVNHRRGARLEGGRLIVSKIYSWFQEDFGRSEAGVVAHLVRYADSALAESLRGRRGIDDYEYDWALNDAAK
jgi:hypothetical protein